MTVEERIREAAKKDLRGGTPTGEFKMPDWESVASAQKYGFIRGARFGFGLAVDLLKSECGPGPDLKTGPQWAEWLEIRMKEKGGSDA